MFKITVNNTVHEFQDKITLKDLAIQLGQVGYVAKVNNRLRELNYYINYTSTVEFLDLTSNDAVRVYETTLRYLIIMAIERLHPNASVRFSQGVSRSLACKVTGMDRKVDKAFLKELDEELQKIIAEDIPIVRRKMTIEEATELYTKKGYTDKVEVLKYRPDDTVNAYQCADYINYMFGYMLPSTGYLKQYGLILYNPGFVVMFPRAETGGELAPFEDSPSFGRMLAAAENWSNYIECDTIAKLNEHATTESVVDLVNMCEAKHNNMLAELGLKIKEDIDNIRLIAIAGPSSSGKTTFSHRLRIELMTRGVKPVKISMDDYYLAKKDAPKDSDGKPDLEHVDALDTELFNQHLLALIQGEEVQLPTFDFTLGIRKPGKKVQVASNQPIIIEGIHALNEKLTASIPRRQKFKIYISPQSHINIDNHNQINATEIRQLRRIVRDAKYRKTSPGATFAMWPSVRRGEFRWIYPFQEEADFIFNTELTYELGVMKKYALPVLNAIDRNDEHFISANRIVKFLKYFRDIDDKYVPCNSLLREFIGDSCFNPHE